MQYRLEVMLPRDKECWDTSILAAIVNKRQIPLGSQVHLTTRQAIFIWDEGV